MKKQTNVLIAIVMFISVVGFSTAKAQTSGPTILRVDIPFAFSISDQTLPAGEYRVTCVNAVSDMKILQLRENAGHATVLVHTSSVTAKTNDDAKLIFNRYGEQYFFAQAWLVGDNVGMQAQKSRREKVMSRELARIQRATEVVAISMKR